jgi:hypothetical protein
LEQNLSKIQEQGLGLAAISYDSVAVLRQFSDRMHITFPLLSDADSAVIKRYGILNETIAKDIPQYGIPNPGTYVLDARGAVTAKYFEDDYRERDTASSILLRQFGLQPVEAHAVTAKHAVVNAWASGSILRPSQTVTLSVDVELPPGVHAYAPGVKGYIPVALSLTVTKAFRVEPPAFPEAKNIELAAIHETVPAYQGRFRVLQTITLANAQTIEPLLDANRALTVEGAFRYQACDDRECFQPESVPLKWALTVQPFDRTRVPTALQRK